MLEKFEVQGVHTELDPKLIDYASKKIGSLDRYLPKASRASAHGEVHLKELKIKSSDRFACEVTLYLPKQTVVIKERAINLYAAVDIAEAKLKIQLAKYKSHRGKNKRHLLARFRRRG